MAEMASQSEHVVKVVFDDDDRIWVVESSDVPGLYLADKTLDGLVAKINLVAPRLLQANEGLDASAPLHIDIPDIRRAGVAHAR